MSSPPTALSPLYRPVGDHGLLVEFGETITQETHALVLRLDAALSARTFEGFRESVPAYVNVLIDFDPTVADHKTVQDAVEALLGGKDTVEVKGETREVLVCYDDEFAPDLRIVTERTGLGVEELIAAHLQGDYSVYMYGFAPGYAYLAGVPEPIQLPRKSAAVRQRKRRQSFTHRIQEAAGVGLRLEAEDRVVGVAYDDHVALGFAPSPALGPQIEDVATGRRWRATARWPLPATFPAQKPRSVRLREPPPEAISGSGGERACRRCVFRGPGGAILCSPSRRTSQCRRRQCNSPSWRKWPPTGRRARRALPAPAGIRS